MSDHMQPLQVEAALDLAPLAHQLSETTRQAKHVAQRGSLTEPELLQVLRFLEQADRMGRLVEAIVDSQNVNEALRQAQRDGVLLWDKLRREFVT
jgi:hypothetical protein